MILKLVGWGVFVVCVALVYCLAFKWGEEAGKKAAKGESASSPKDKNSNNQKGEADENRNPPGQTK